MRRYSIIGMTASHMAASHNTDILESIDGTLGMVRPCLELITDESVTSGTLQALFLGMCHTSVTGII